MHSRVLGPIELDGGAGGGAMESVIPFGGRHVALRLEIDYPDRLTQFDVNQIDATLESLDIPDTMARDAIAAQLSRDGSAPAQLFSDWTSSTGGGVDEFLGQLGPSAMTFAPDGGKANPYPLIMRYGVADPAFSQQITVRLPRRATGPEVDRTLRAG